MKHDQRSGLVIERGRFGGENAGIQGKSTPLELFRNELYAVLVTPVGASKSRLVAKCWDLYGKGTQPSCLSAFPSVFALPDYGL